MRKKARLVFASVLLIGSAWAQDRGVITGTVLDENGTPVIKAKVLISEKGVRAMHRVLQFHETDANGRFRIAHVRWGTYLVTVGKEDAGYADTGLGLYCHNAYPMAVLTDDSPTADVTLRLGPKAGVLELEPVTDVRTGKEIHLAAIRLKCAENSDLFMYTSAAQRRFLVPPLTDVLVEISAEGYKSWPAPDRSATEGRIFLHPEQTQKLQVSLEPEEPGSALGEN